MQHDISAGIQGKDNKKPIKYFETEQMDKTKQLCKEWALVWVTFQIFQ